jgi:DUF1707 SHOCT-like domain
MPRRSALRASDADREHVVERLREAAAEGRLLAEELEHRLGAALSARTYGELDAVVADLPRDRVIERARRQSVIRLRPATVFALLILFPVALATAVAALIAVAALLTAWALAVTLAGVLLGSRGRALGGPWAVGCRAWRGRRTERGVAGSFTPWL